MAESVTAAELRAAFGRTVEERFSHRLTLNVPGRGNQKLTQIIDRINHDDELYALWLAANVNAVERLGMTDHGPVHVKIVMNIAVKHRSGHEEMSLFVAQSKIRELLDGIYDVGTATILRAEILHAIIAHRSGGKPLTLEAGIVRVADALDMAKGRSRIPFAT